MKRDLRTLTAPPARSRAVAPAGRGNGTRAADDSLRHRTAEALDQLALAVARRVGTGSDDGRDSLEELQQRLRLLGQLAAGLPQVDARAIPTDRAGYGSVVDIVDLDTRQGERFTLTSGIGIDFDAGHVSLASPIGQALLGRRAGDAVVVDTPRGRRRLRVARVTTLHDLLDVAALLRGGDRDAA